MYRVELTLEDNKDTDKFIAKAENLLSKICVCDKTISGITREITPTLKVIEYFKTTSISFNIVEV